MKYKIIFREISVLEHYEEANSMEDAVCQFNQKAEEGQIDFLRMDIVESQIIRAELVENCRQEPMGES